jgi:ABC-type phosphate transport system substrate-binding protein
LDVELTAQEAASMPDVAVVPMVAYAVAAAYSVDVFAYGSLRFDLPTLADIYLGKSRTPHTLHTPHTAHTAHTAHIARAVAN